MAKITAIFMLLGLFLGGTYLVLATTKQKKENTTASTHAASVTSPDMSNSSATRATSPERPDTAQLDTAIIPAPKKTEPPSLLGFINQEISQKERALLKSMKCFEVNNIEAPEWRANNLAPFLMAKMIVMQDVLDSIRAHQRFTKADSFDIFTRYLNDHYDEMMPKSVSSVSKKKSIKKNKKK